MNWGSVYRGLRVMTVSLFSLWEVKLGRCDGFWAKAWTPTWADGRGPYVSIGLGVIVIMRGY